MTTRQLAESARCHERCITLFHAQGEQSWGSAFLRDCDLFEHGLRTCRSNQ